MISLFFKRKKQLGYKLALVAFIFSISSSVQSAESDHSDHSDHAGHLPHHDSHVSEFELPLLKALSDTDTTELSSNGEGGVRTPFKQPKTLRLSDYKGKVVYIDFWASWCAPCLISMPLLNDLRNKYKDSGFEVIAINLDEDINLATMRIMNIDYPVVHDAGGKIAKQYNIAGLPSAYIMNSNGDVELIHKGFKKSDIHFIEAVVSKLLDDID